MPTLLDPEQQALASEDTSTIAAALGGGGPSAATPDVPQSKSKVIAERLLGPELAERYGDVLGLRKEKWSDFWRDFGNEFAGRGNAERLKQRVLDQYNQKYQQERQAAAEQDQANVQKINTFVGLIRQMKDIPKGHRTGILKAALEKLDMQGSPEAVKLLADVENFDAEKVLTPEMIDTLLSDSSAGIAQIADVLGDPQAAVALKKGILQMKQTQEETRSLISRREREDQAAQRSAVTNIRAAAEDELTARANGLASAEQPYLQIFAGKTDDEIRAIGLQGDRAGAKAQSSLDAMLAEAMGKEGPTGAPRVTVRKKGEAAPAAPAGPVGIPQQTSSPVAAATGTPTTTPPAFSQTTSTLR